jgi:hypothetical protein
MSSSVSSLPYLKRKKGNKYLHVYDVVLQLMHVGYPDNATSALTLMEKPHCLALLPDGLVAVTTFHPMLYLLSVTEALSVSTTIFTQREYR